jgi:hypothetical protein
MSGGFFTVALYLSEVFDSRSIKVGSLFLEATIVSDVRLNLDEVGAYLGRYAPTVSYNCLLLIAESAEFEKENINVRSSHNRLF